jgi:hypothetical protein
MVEDVVGGGFDPVLVIDVLEMDTLVDEVADVGPPLGLDRLPEEDVDKEELLNVKELVLADGLELTLK